MSKIKKIVVLLGDIVVLYGALLMTLAIRYGIENVGSSFIVHFRPFTVVFLVWLVIFYINDLYKNEFLRINYPTTQKFLFSIAINITASIMLFYLFPAFFELTPKTNLFLITAIFGLIDLGWRFLVSKIYISNGLKNRLFVIGNSKALDEILNYVKTNPQLGYETIIHTKDFSEIKNLIQICIDKKINTIIIQSQLKNNPEVVKAIYKLLSKKISIVDSITFYEIIFQKIALEELEESWFLEKIIPHHPIYETIKRILDIILSAILIIILFPIMLLVIILIKLTSKGSSIYTQERTGLNDKIFILYKFRSMISNHSGPLATAENDNRITSIGKFIRYTHIDEIPQLFNILKGNISFIGPRAEASKLVEIYSQLPYYDLRHIIKPGLTGWAQVNYKPSSTLEEANEKLKYDIYYIKNRSLALDFLILLKTVKYLFMSLK
jgi:exopolysaccharide biosynthesis polyprenyl glycosylphosphotransferase